MFKFLKPLPKTPGETAADDGAAASIIPAAVPAAVNGHAPGDDAPGGSLFDIASSADLEPIPGVLGMDEARAALAAVASARPRSMFFLAAPRSGAHREALAGLLAEQARGLAKADAVVAVCDFEWGAPRLLRLPAAEARLLARQVAEAVEMLAVTIPAAFDADSYKVARLALEEELRSGHDRAIDALKRKAAAQNICLLRTPQGYAVAPMHEGRVVQPEVLRALPDGLKADVEAKLATFQGELSGVLKDRAGLQQSFRERLRDLDREVASLAVSAALGESAKPFAAYPAVIGYLDRLRADLTANAALFVAATRAGGGEARAPVEVQMDPQLARYRVNVIAPSARDGTGLEQPETLDRAELAGLVRPSDPSGFASPMGIVAGALTRAGGGIVLIDATDLLAQYSAWPLLKRAMRAQAVSPAATDGRVLSGPGLALPVDCRLVVAGDAGDYQSLCRLDGDIARQMRLIPVFEPSVALSPKSQRLFARHVAGILAEEGLQPLDGPAIAALVGDRSQTGSGAVRLSTDLDAARDIVTAATVVAQAAGRTVTQAEDVITALKRRADRLAAAGGAQS